MYGYGSDAMTITLPKYIVFSVTGLNMFNFGIFKTNTIHYTDMCDIPDQLNNQVQIISFTVRHLYTYTYRISGKINIMNACWT